MKHSNISIFIPHIGCPNMCSFCNQHTISGAQSAPGAEDVKKICSQALSEVKNPGDAEIAFFGGSFTAVPHRYMLELLEAAQEFLGDGRFSGIRVSTRPDCIDSEVLELLKKYHVTSIELGAQSMSDEVLDANRRGHTSKDVTDAAELIREYGFELGLQVMIGLYKSTSEAELGTLDRILEIHPDTVRIYPVVILKGTELGRLYESGEYVTLTFDEVVEIVSIYLMMAEQAGIKVIKCGLHASEFVERDMIGGFYHPAFREICENNIYRSRMEEMTAYTGEDGFDFVFAVNPSCISKAVGQKKCNIEYFRKQGINIKIIGDKNVPKYQCELRRQQCI